jgi:hypothetical protein
MLAERTRRRSSQRFSSICACSLVQRAIVGFVLAMRALDLWINALAEAPRAGANIHCVARTRNTAVIVSSFLNMR